ncbi:hypothetical protein ACFYYS_06095 [Streptomyces sp. NPDC002120]|uniref:hypothetical protein n=1 Tax=Streptomyces sp. NPDC002120 TaxID=3364631 RepID=UPI00367F4A20
MDDSETGTAVWVFWTEDEAPTSFAVFPDCPVTSDGDEGCCHYLAHPGGHSWELTDPEHDLWQAIAPTLHFLTYGDYGPFKP